jgi:hypothetical protein
LLRLCLHTNGGLRRDLPQLLPAEQQRQSTSGADKLHWLMLLGRLMTESLAHSPLQLAQAELLRAVQAERRTLSAMHGAHMSGYKSTLLDDTVYSRYLLDRLQL